VDIVSQLPFTRVAGLPRLLAAHVEAAVPWWLGAGLAAAYVALHWSVSQRAVESAFLFALEPLVASVTYAVCALAVVGAAQRVARGRRVPQPPALAASAAPDSPDCPKCSAPMRLRKAIRGPHAGARYWGCSRFPRCDGVRSARRFPPARRTDPAAAAESATG